MVETEVLNGGVEKAAIIQIADEKLHVLAKVLVVRGHIGGAELIGKVFLKSGGGHDGVHEELPALLVVAAAVVVLQPRLSPVLAPLLVHLAGGIVVVPISRIFWSRVLKGDFRCLDFEHRIDFRLLLNDVPEFQGGCLKDVQALLHLRPDRELLGLSLIKSLVGHIAGTEPASLVLASRIRASCENKSRGGGFVHNDGHGEPIDLHVSKR